jgi:hypothetical protein
LPIQPTVYDIIQSNGLQDRAGHNIWCILWATRRRRGLCSLLCQPVYDTQYGGTASSCTAYEYILWVTRCTRHEVTYLWVVSGARLVVQTPQEVKWTARGGGPKPLRRSYGQREGGVFKCDFLPPCPPMQSPDGAKQEYRSPKTRRSEKQDGTEYKDEVEPRKCSRSKIVRQ